MEKRTPHYRLEKVKRIVSDRNSRPFTMTALRGGLALGLTEPVMREIVLALRRADFYKSMTTHLDHKLWQDCLSRNDARWNSGLYKSHGLRR